MKEDLLVKISSDDNNDLSAALNITKERFDVLEKLIITSFFFNK